MSARTTTLFWGAYASALSGRWPIGRPSITGKKWGYQVDGPPRRKKNSRRLRWLSNGSRERGTKERNETSLRSTVFGTTSQVTTRRVRPWPITCPFRAPASRPRYAAKDQRTNEWMNEWMNRRRAGHHLVQRLFGGAGPVHHRAGQSRTEHFDPAAGIPLLPVRGPRPWHPHQVLRPAGGRNFAIHSL